MKRDGIVINGHKGTWYVIDETTCYYFGKVYLLEHEQHGDAAPALIVTEDCTVILDDVYNGFGDLEEYIDMLKWAKEIEAAKKV